MLDKGDYKFLKLSKKLIHECDAFSDVLPAGNISRIHRSTDWCREEDGSLPCRGH